MNKEYKSFESLKKLLRAGIHNNIGDLIILLKNLKREGYNTLNIELGMKYEDYEETPSPYIKEIGAFGFSCRVVKPVKKVKKVD